MRKNLIALLICQLVCINFCIGDTMVMEDNIAKFKNRSKVDDWLLQFKIEDDHLTTCKAQANSCCFESQTLTAKKGTVNSKTSIIIEGSAVGTSCPTDSADASKKKLSIQIYGYTNDNDLLSSTGKLIFSTNIGQAKDTTQAETVSNASLIVTDKTTENHYALNLPSINSNSYNEQQALNHIMIVTAGEDGHMMSSSILKISLALCISLLVLF